MLDRLLACRLKKPAAILAGCVSAILLFAPVPMAGVARAEPAIRSAQDAACRQQARAQVFSAPDPTNLGLHEIGRRIYHACMRGSGRAAGRARHHRRHYHYRRRR